MQQDLFVTASDSAAPQLDLPGADIAYYPDFIADHEQVFKALLDEVEWQQDEILMYGKPMLIPRLNAWYGDSDAHYGYSGIALAPKPWSAALLQLKNQLQDQLSSTLFKHCRFNSVLANLYRDGSDSVSWHSDDEPELGKQPLIASLSLGAPRRFSLRARFPDRPLFTETSTTHIDLLPGSLLVMAGDTQHNWQHQIAKTRKPVGARINLTFRSIVSQASAGNH